MHLLCDEEISFVILEKLVELKDIWMVHLLKNTNLRKQLLLLFLLEILLVNDFDSPQSIRFLVQTLTHLAVCT